MMLAAFRLVLEVNYDLYVLDYGSIQLNSICTALSAQAAPLMAVVG